MLPQYAASDRRKKLNDFFCCFWEFQDAFALALAAGAIDGTKGSDNPVHTARISTAKLLSGVNREIDAHRQRHSEESTGLMFNHGTRTGVGRFSGYTTPAGTMSRFGPDSSSKPPRPHPAHALLGGMADPPQHAPVDDSALYDIDGYVCPAREWAVFACVYISSSPLCGLRQRP